MAKLYPYERILREHAHKQNTVTIERRDAAFINGRVNEVAEEGFYLEGKYLGQDYFERTFIAYEDVRGVIETAPMKKR